jgi:hypothetical protein
MRGMMCKDEARVKLVFARHLEAVFLRGRVLSKRRQSGQRFVVQAERPGKQTAVFWQSRRLIPGIEPG